MDFHFGYYFFVVVIYFGEGFISFAVRRGFSTDAFLGLFDEMLNRMRPISHARSHLGAMNHHRKLRDVI